MEKKYEIMKPQKTYFFEDGDKRIFATNEKEAWSLVSNRSEWRRRDIKLIGTSDGKTYYKIVNDANVQIQKLNERVKELKESLTRYVEGHDRMLFDEFVPEDDKRVVRAKELIKNTQKELEPLENEANNIRSTVIQKAFNAELEIARRTPEMPSPHDFIGHYGDNTLHNAAMDNARKARGI